MKRRLAETVAGLAILQVLRQLRAELGASYRLMRRDLHVL